MFGPKSDDFFGILSMVVGTVHEDRSATTDGGTTLATGLRPSAVPGDRKRVKIPFSCPAGEPIQEGRYKEELVLFDAPTGSGITVDGIEHRVWSEVLERVPADFLRRLGGTYAEHVPKLLAC